jgi:hypothetical protein
MEKQVFFTYDKYIVDAVSEWKSLEEEDKEAKKYLRAYRLIALAEEKDLPNGSIKEYASKAKAK